MPIKKEPFRSYTLTDKPKKDIFTVRLNNDERSWLDECKVALQQPKDSTCIKMLAQIGMYNVLHDASTRYILRTVFINKKRNDRTGIPLDDQNFERL